MFNIVNQVLKRHLAFTPLGQVDERTAKPSPFTIQSRLTELLRIMAAETLQNPYRLQTVTCKLS